MPTALYQKNTNPLLFSTMANSQNSFETRVGRFQDMVAILHKLPDYKPTNALINPNELKTFLTEILDRNNDVITYTTSLKAKRDERRSIAFKDGLTNPDCIQGCLENIVSYAAGELGTTHPAYKQFLLIRKKISPTYAKKTEVAADGTVKATRSTSEKSFTGLVGLAKQAIQIATSLGASYAPQNPNIQLENFGKKVEELDTINQHIALSLQKYSDAVLKRKEAYDGTNGMKERTAMVRNYLASFSGGRNNPNYIQVMQALKGS